MYVKKTEIEVLPVVDLSGKSAFQNFFLWAMQHRWEGSMHAPDKIAFRSLNSERLITIANPQLADWRCTRRDIFYERMRAFTLHGPKE